MGLYGEEDLKSKLIKWKESIQAHAVGSPQAALASTADVSVRRHEG